MFVCKGDFVFVLLAIVCLHQSKLPFSRARTKDRNVVLNKTMVTNFERNVRELLMSPDVVPRLDMYLDEAFVDGKLETIVTGT